jgi:hypothetical protein
MMFYDRRVSVSFYRGRGVKLPFPAHGSAVSKGEDVMLKA